MWFLCCSSHFSAAFNSSNILLIVPLSKALWWPWSALLLPFPPLLPPLLLLPVPLLLFFSIILFLLGDDPHGHFLLGDVILSGHRIVKPPALTDGRGRGGDGVCVVKGCWYSIEGDEANEDDYQRDQVECRELRQDREWTGELVSKLFLIYTYSAVHVQWVLDPFSLKTAACCGRKQYERWQWT